AVERETAARRPQLGAPRENVERAARVELRGHAARGRGHAESARERSPVRSNLERAHDEQLIARLCGLDAKVSARRARDQFSFGAQLVERPTKARLVRRFHCEQRHEVDAAVVRARRPNFRTVYGDVIELTVPEPLQYITDGHAPRANRRAPVGVEY